MYHGVPTTLSTYFKISVLDFATLLIILTVHTSLRKILWCDGYFTSTKFKWGEGSGEGQRLKFKFSEECFTYIYN